MTDALIHADMTAADAAILADALLERGDKYGEFIARSLAGDPTAENLRRRYQKTWLGPLAAFLEQVEYEHGLPRAAAVKRKPGKATKKALAHPLLRTLRKLTTAYDDPTRLTRTNVSTYEAFARAMVPHALREIEVADGQLATLAEHGARFTHLHDLRILDGMTQRELRDPRWSNVRWVEIRGSYFFEMIDVLAADQGLFRRNRPDVVMNLTWSAHIDAGYLREAFAELPVASFLLPDQLRCYRVDGEIRFDELVPPVKSMLDEHARADRARSLASHRQIPEQLITALEQDRIDEARELAHELCEYHYARWGQLRLRARAARTSGNLPLADLFDEICGRRVSH